MSGKNRAYPINFLLFGQEFKEQALALNLIIEQ